MGDAAAVAYDVKALIFGFQILVKLHFHVIEFYFHTVEQGIVIGCAGGDFIQCLDHLYDAVQNSIGKDQA